ncbi:ABC transporter ATP-binding protein [soil metagenome]
MSPNASRPNTSLMSVAGLGKNFGGLAAVADLSFTVERGEVLAIIGPNGAGKTTTLDMISGMTLPSSGKVHFRGEDITRLSPAARCRLGIGRAFQVVQPFHEMSVLENVLVGALFGKAGVGEREGRRIAAEALERCGLAAIRDKPSEELTLMEEKRLEIARALATQPEVLLLDEVMAGLRPAEAREAVGLVRSVQESGVTVIFIEHVMPVVRDLADRVVVMDYGKKLAEGSYAEVTRHPKVIEAYLGSEEVA